jgi:hypothetical protein
LFCAEAGGCPYLDISSCGWKKLKWRKGGKEERRKGGKEERILGKEQGLKEEDKS